MFAEQPGWVWFYYAKIESVYLWRSLLVTTNFSCCQLHHTARCWVWDLGVLYKIVCSGFDCCLPTVFFFLISVSNLPAAVCKPPWLQEQRKPHPVCWSPETFTADTLRTENRRHGSTQAVLMKSLYPQTLGEKLLPIWEGGHLRQWPSSYLVRNDIP